MKRKITIGVIALGIIGIIGFFVFRNMQKAQEAALSQFQTSPIEIGELTALVGATGTVHANQTSTLTWQTTGRVGEVFVELEDQVTQGQKLAELSQDSLSQTIILAQAELITNQRALENLLNSDVEIKQAYQGMVAAQNELEDALEDRETLNYGRANQNSIDGARADYLLAEDKVKDAEEAYTNVEHLPEDDRAHILALSNLAAARKERDKALANLNYLIGSADELEIAEADARVEVAQADLEDAEREWDRLKDGPDPEDVEAARARVASSEATLKLAYLEAPFDGTITDIDAKVGDEVSTGTTAFRLDDLTHMLIDVDIPEVDINRIEVGQEATLTFDAIQNKEYSGTVTEVGRVGVTTQGVVNFTVTIELSNMDSMVHPGMTAAINVVVTQLENVLLVPNRAVRNRDNQQIIYLLQEGRPTPVEIEVGASSDINSQIESGDVKEGDLVILNPPTDMMMGGGGGGGPH